MNSLVPAGMASTAGFPILNTKKPIQSTKLQFDHSILGHNVQGSE